MKDGCWFATGAALDSAGQQGFNENDIYDCIVNHLSDSHFHKTMASEKKLGLMQDVYYITYQTVRLYVKLQVCGDAVVVSFKEA